VVSVRPVKLSGVNPKRFLALFLLALFGGFGAHASTSLTNIQTVFIIVMENHDWSDIYKQTNACPYINNVLLPGSSFAAQYYNPPGLHPSEPNYIWLEGGTNFGITNNDIGNRISSTNHLVTLLQKSGVSWKSYHEGIDPLIYPIQDAYPYTVRHNPQILFSDVADNTNYCLAHIRPYTEFISDLQNNAVPRYNFLVPSVDHDMHDYSAQFDDPRTAGDHWLSLEIPRIMASPAYKNNGAIFITWDEGEVLSPDGVLSDGPIGMIVVSPLAKGHGYSNTIHYDHGSTLRTMQEIFSVTPFLGNANSSSNLEDLFTFVSLKAKVASNQINIEFGGLSSSRTLVVEQSDDVKTWAPVRTNFNVGSSVSNSFPATNSSRFFRGQNLP
jgi:hypothetical protein